MFKDFFSKWRYRQYLYCISAISTASVSIIHSSWSSPMIPLLKSEDSPIGVTLTTMETSLVVGLYIGGFILGCLLTLKTIDLIGRKINILIGGALSFIAWVFIYFARSVELLYVGRIIAGVGGIICVHLSSIYCTEMADNDNRGKLALLLTVFNNIGTILGYVAGPYLSYGAFALIGAISTLFVMIGVLFIPESPYFLIKTHKYEEAEKLLWKLSYKEHDKDFVLKKTETIVKSVQDQMINNGTLSELLFSGKYKRSLFIHFGLCFILYFSGVSQINSYLLTILQESGSSLSSNTSSVIFGIVQFITSLVSGEVVDRLGRKPLLIASCSGSSFTIFTFGLYFYIKDRTGYNIDGISWLPLTCMIIFQIFIAIGILPLPGLITAELYPINIKGLALSTVGMIASSVGLVLQITFEPLNEFWGIYTTFWIFSGCTFLAVFFAVFILPETKGKSFAEIQMEINPGKKVEIIRESGIFAIT